jgi:hypothetical protein
VIKSSSNGKDSEFLQVAHRNNLFVFSSPIINRRLEWHWDLSKLTNKKIEESAGNPVTFNRQPSKHGVLKKMITQMITGALNISAFRF